MIRPLPGSIVINVESLRIVLAGHEPNRRYADGYDFGRELYVLSPDGSYFTNEFAGGDKRTPAYVVY